MPNAHSALEWWPTCDQGKVKAENWRVYDPELGKDVEATIMYVIGESPSDGPPWSCTCPAMEVPALP